MRHGRGAWRILRVHRPAQISHVHPSLIAQDGITAQYSDCHCLFRQQTWAASSVPGQVRCLRFQLLPQSNQYRAVAVTSASNSALSTIQRK
jgi:hypothetical protein